ncbi:MAG: (2Fe-2S) ferredoxin domain-containing protein [Candidatus Melainabacteria bacterium]|nr:(2Fe-2S) ferredoxin domain-containing protein [Candidatus Melainabacteria bacterium]
MGKPTKIYVCIRGKKCPKRGSKKVLAELQAEVANQASSLEVNGCGCLGTCKKGPSLIVTPDKVRYGRVRPQDSAEIVKAHSAGTGPVEKLVITKKKKK